MAHAEEDKVLLGLMAPLSGIVSIYGQEISMAAKIACEEVNENGGVLGRPLEIVTVDDGSLPKTAVPAARNLIQHHRCVAMIGNLLSNSRISVATQVAEAKRIPLLNFSFYEGSISSRYFFHFAALPNQQIDRMIPYMAERFGSKMFFAGHNYEWPRGSIDAAKRCLINCGGEVVGEEYHPIGNPDFVRLLERLATSGADVFVPYFAGVDQIKLLRTFSKAGLKNRMEVVMGHYDEAMVQMLEPEVRAGFFSSNTYFMSLPSEENARYLDRLARLKEINGIWPAGNGILTNFGEGTYLCVKAFAAAANAAGTVAAESLVEALRHVEVTGPQGTVIMDPVTHHAAVNTYLARCERDGSFSLVKSFGRLAPQVPGRYLGTFGLEKPQAVAIPEQDPPPASHSVGIASFDVSGEMRQVTSAFCQIVGRDESSLLRDETLMTLVLADCPEGGVQVLRDLLSQKRDSFEVLRQMGPNQTRPVVFHLVTSHGKDDCPIAFVVKVRTANELINEIQREPVNEEFCFLGKIGIGFVGTDMQGNITFANKNFLQLWGFERDDQCQGLSFASFFEQSNQLKTMICKYHSEHWNGEVSAQTKLGKVLFQLSLELRENELREKKGYTFTLVPDLGRRVVNDPFRTILKIADIAILAADEDGIIVQANEGAERLFGYGRNELPGTSINQLLPPRCRNKNCSYIQQIMHASSVNHLVGARGEISGYRKDGSEFPAEVTYSKVESTSGWYFVLTLRDITQRKNAEEALVWQATHDSLTNLPNRGLIKERLVNALQRSIRNQSAIALLFVDLDGFKLINDSYGHTVGDEVLIQVAERLIENVRPGDTVGRFGGDEFIVLCEQVSDPNGVPSLVDRLTHALKRPMKVKGQPLFVTASIGIAYGRGGESSADELLRNSDSAMYLAKEEGRDGWRIFDEAIHQQAKEQLSLANGLRVALKNRELFLVCQPIVNSQDGTMLGAEMLMRWKRNDQLISPASFIPVAERMGMIGSLGLWAFRQACLLQKHWQDKFGVLRAPYLSVNVSPKQLADPKFGTSLAAILAETGVDPGGLLLEITETALIRDSEWNRQILASLGDLGLRLAIDDFGSGYSSLVQLMKLPVDHLKVDRAFVEGLTQSNRSKAIVNAVIRMAHALDLKVIAEGVETRGQMLALQELRCDAHQGFYFHRPMMPQDCEAILEEQYQVAG